MLPGQMSLWGLASVKNGLRNLPLKFGPNQATNSWDIDFFGWVAGGWVGGGWVAGEIGIKAISTSIDLNWVELSWVEVELGKIVSCIFFIRIHHLMNNGFDLTSPDLTCPDLTCPNLTWLVLTWPVLTRPVQTRPVLTQPVLTWQNQTQLTPSRHLADTS